MAGKGGFGRDFDITFLLLIIIILFFAGGGLDF
jgi:hypothetical protein